MTYNMRLYDMSEEAIMERGSGVSFPPLPRGEALSCKPELLAKSELVRLNHSLLQKDEILQ